jgi:sulfur-oxidizing protein SoxY
MTGNLASAGRFGQAWLVARRDVLIGAGLGLMVLTVPARAAPRPSLEGAVLAFTGGMAPRDGRVRLDVPQLVENGNAVGIAVDVESPMRPDDHVRRIAVINEKNPQADIAVFRLGPRAGRAHVATRIRLATSQTLIAVAEMSDGSFWSTRADVIVTLAACIEDL